MATRRGRPAHDAGRLQPVSGVHRVDTSLTVGQPGLSVPVTWWLPEAPVPGRVWLQHGFARTRHRMADLAASLGAAGFVVLTTGLRSFDRYARTVQRLADNRAFLAELAVALRTAAPPVPTSAGDPFLVVGHSAGAEAAAFVAARLARRAPVAGAVLLDPVRSLRGHNLPVALRTLASANVPVRLVAAPPSICNAHGSGVACARTILPGFLGVEVRQGSHADAEGRSSDRLAQLVCGPIRPDNAAAVRSLTRHWLTAMAHGRPPGPDEPPVPDLAPHVRLLWGDRLASAPRPRHSEDP